MKHVLSTALVLVAVINVYPMIGVLGVDRLQSLYGVAIEGSDLELLLRHRAVMLGLVGGLLLAAAWLPSLRLAAVIVGLVSMLSFVLLALPLSQHGAALQRVFWADVVASILLLAALASWRRRPP